MKDATETPVGLVGSINFRLPPTDYVAFRKIAEEDFGYSLSDAARAAIRLLIEQRERRTRKSA